MQSETNRTLLLVEDEAIIAKFEALMLQKYGFRVITAYRGTEAINIAVSNPEIELVLMDINLGGGMDGPEAAEEILKQRDLPVVFLSGHTEHDVVEKTEGITSYGYVMKSSPETVIITSIKMAFRLHEARRKEKEKEAMLREQDALYHAILRTTMDGFWICTFQGDLIDVNDTYCQMSGYTREELLSMKIGDLDVNENQEQATEHIHFVLANLQDRFETSHRRKDGSIYPVEASIQYRPEMGERTIGFFRDITTRKQAEEKLRVSQERYRHISTITSDITYSCRRLADGGYTIDWVSGALEKITGYTQNELLALGCWGKLVIDEDVERFERNVSNLLPGEKGQCELRIRAKDGELHWLISKAECLDNDDGLFSRHIFGGLVDISARKKVDAELEASATVLEQQQKTLYVLNRIITLANHFHELDYLFDAILSEALNLMDYDAGGLYLLDPDNSSASVVHAINIPEEFLKTVKVIKTTSSPYDTLFIHGQPILTDFFERVSPEHAALTGFCSLISVPIFIRDRVVGALNLASKRRYSVTSQERDTLLSIGRELGNIIERISNEQEVKTSADNLETLFNSIDELVFLLDMQGNILKVNQAVCRRLHYGADELINSDVLALHVPERRDEAQRIVMGMIAGSIDACPVPILTKEGERVEVETRVTRGQWNHQPALIGVTRDITERKRAEDALAQAYQEKRHLLQELQHRAKNSFAMISSMIGLMGDTAADEAAKKALSELRPRVRAMAELYDLLYATNSIHDVTLSEYSSRICASIAGLEPVELVQTYEAITVRSTIAAPFGLILTELLTNAVKHAFPGHQHGKVAISLARSGSGARLMVADDGLGLPPEFTRHNRTSLGLMLVEILTEQLHGQFTIEKGPERGTICVMDFPL